MATHIKFCDAVDLGGSSIEGPARAFQVITESASSQATTITALQNEVAVITSTADIYVTYGQSPDVTTDTRELLTAGSRIFIRMNNNDRVAVRTI
jgi:hypothetical protein